MIARILDVLPLPLMKEGGRAEIVQTVSLGAEIEMSLL